MKKRFILSVLLLLSILTYSQNSEKDCESARQKYLQQNPDVARAGMNAWTHYTTFGKKEGRKWPKCDNSEAQNELYSESDNNIYNSASVEVKPNYPGGLDNFYNFFLKNFQVQNEEELKGNVFVTFVVEKDGSLSDIKVLRDIGYGTGKEAVRILKSCPRWNPGEQNGKKVRVLYTLPIKLEIGPTKEPTKSNDSTQNLSQCISGDCVNGKGVSIRPTGNKYEGEFKNEKMDGRGTYYWTTGEKFEGEFKNGKRVGNGTYYNKDGGKYEGEYKNDAMEGYGTYYFADGNKYQGEFKNNLMHGKGTYYYNSGVVFEGYYINDKREGIGEFSVPGLGTIIGKFINGDLEGEVNATYANGWKYVGKFRDFLPDGYGKMTYPDGSIKEGIWENGNLINDYNKSAIVSNEKLKKNDVEDDNWLMKAFIWGFNEAEKNPKPYSYTPTASSNSSTQKKQKRNVYICTAQSYASCCKLVASTTFGYPKTGCCTRADGNGCSSGHSWSDVGEEGETQYVCSYCNISVNLKTRPRNSGCCSGRGGCGGHSWSEIK